MKYISTIKFIFMKIYKHPTITIFYKMSKKEAILYSPGLIKKKKFTIYTQTRFRN